VPNLIVAMGVLQPHQFHLPNFKYKSNLDHEDEVKDNALEHYDEERPVGGIALLHEM